jgi:hypothetical protein
VGNFIVLRQLILEATKGETDLFGEHNIDKVLSIAKNPIEYPMTPTSGAHFGDDKVQLNYLAGVRNYMQSAFLSKTPANYFSDSWSWSRFMGDALYYDLRMNSNNRYQASKRADFTNLKHVTYYENSGILVSRPSDDFSVGGLAATIKYFGGSEEVGGGHNHDEVGAYVISANGLIVAGDVGCQSYDKYSFYWKETDPMKPNKRYEENGRANSYGHPVPYINGQVQKRSWLVSKNKPNVLKEHTKLNVNGVDKIVLDMKQAYNNTEIASLIRTYEYKRINETKQMVKITDEVTFNTEAKFEVAMTSLGKWWPNSDRKSGKFSYAPKHGEKVQIKGEQSVNVSIESSHSFSLKEERLFNSDLSYTRIGITLEKPVKSAWISVIYSN